MPTKRKNPLSFVASSLIFRIALFSCWISSYRSRRRETAYTDCFLDGFQISVDTLPLRVIRNSNGNKRHSSRGYATHSERMKRPLMATRIASISVRELWPQIVKRQILISTNQLHRYYYHWIVRDIPDREKERTLGSVPDDSRGNSEFHPTRPFHSLPRPLVPRRSSAPAYQLKLLWTACCGIHKEMMFLEELIILGTTAVHKSFSWITLKLSYSSEHIRNTYPSILQYHHNPRPFLLNCSIRSHYFKYSLLLRG